MKKITVISLVMILLAALAYTLGADKSDRNVPDFALGQTSCLKSGVNKVYFTETGELRDFNSVSYKVLGYKMTARKCGNPSDSGNLYMNETGQDNDFSFLLGVLPTGYLYSSYSNSSFSSIVPDARLAVGEVKAYFEGSRDLDVMCGLFDNKDNYQTYMFIYSTKDTILSGSIPSDSGLTVYNVNLYRGWNRVVSVHKDSLTLVRNGNLENPEWAIIR